MKAWLPWLMLVGGVVVALLDGPAPLLDLVGIPLAAGGVALLVGGR